MTSTGAAILVLLDSPVFATNVIPFRCEIFLVTTRTRWRVFGRGIANILIIVLMTITAPYVLIVVARVAVNSRACLRVGTRTVIKFVRRRPTIGCVTGIAFLRGFKMTICFTSRYDTVMTRRSTSPRRNPLVIPGTAHES